MAWWPTQNVLRARHILHPLPSSTMAQLECDGRRVPQSHPALQDPCVGKGSGVGCTVQVGPPQIWGLKEQHPDLLGGGRRQLDGFA